MEGIPNVGNPHWAVFSSISASRSTKGIYSARFSPTSLTISWASQGLGFELSTGNMDIFLLPLVNILALLLQLHVDKN